MKNLIRVDKYLSEMGIGSRSQIKEGAKKGYLQINDSIEKKTDQKIDPDHDIIKWNGQVVQYAKQEYYMLNKPAGVVSATQDNLHRTVIDLIADKKRNDLFPVGRLDLDTEGLLLITNDGELAHALLSPRHHVTKVYEADLTGILPDNCMKQFEQGIILKDGTKTLPAKLEILTIKPNGAKIRLSICEGKFHQVKRMFEAVDCKVTYLKRIRMGPLELDSSLTPGEYRTLSKDELRRLKGKAEC